MPPGERSIAVESTMIVEHAVAISRPTQLPPPTEPASDSRGTAADIMIELEERWLKRPVRASLHWPNERPGGRKEAGGSTHQ
jgi:hypothetical protein